MLDEQKRQKPFREFESEAITDTAKFYPVLAVYKKGASTQCRRSKSTERAPYRSSLCMLAAIFTALIKRGLSMAQRGICIRRQMCLTAKLYLANTSVHFNYLRIKPSTIKECYFQGRRNRTSRCLISLEACALT